MNSPANLTQLKHRVRRIAQLSRQPRLALFEAHRQIVSPRKRNMLADAAAYLLRCRNGLSFSFGADHSVGADADRLTTEGLVPWKPLLTTSQIAEIMHWLAPKLCRYPYQPDGPQFLPENAPPEFHLAEYPPSAIVRAPHLFQIANDRCVLAVVERFLGAKPTISNLSLWWSFPRQQKAKEAQLFHRDVDDLRFCKLFLYLTEVDMGGGPHVFVKGSPLSETCCQIRRYHDDEIVDAFGENAITYLCGGAGFSFIANTHGIHKGLPPTQRPRLIFQVQYSLFPLLSSSYDPPDILPNSAAGDPYVDRLYVTPSA